MVARSSLSFSVLHCIRQKLLVKAVSFPRSLSTVLFLNKTPTGWAISLQTADDSSDVLKSVLVVGCLQLIISGCARWFDRLCSSESTMLFAATASWGLFLVDFIEKLHFPIWRTALLEMTAYISSPSLHGHISSVFKSMWINWPWRSIKTMGLGHSSNMFFWNVGQSASVGKLDMFWLWFGS